MNVDLRTLILVLGITNFIQVIALYVQYLSNKTYRGIGWWLLAFLSIAVGFILTLLRDVMTFDLVTIIAGNTLTISGPIFIYIGVTRFLGRKFQRWSVICSYLIFFLGFFYFTYGQSDINARSVVSSVIIAFYSFLTAWNIYVYKPSSIRASGNFLSAAWCVQGIFFVFRALDLLTVSPIHSYFTSTMIQTTTYLFVLGISMSVTFGLIIMVNQRLNADTRLAKEHFELIFHTSPDATLITRLEDGVIIDANEGFTTLSGMTKEEVIGKSILAVNIYKDPADRQKIVDVLRERGNCENYEARFLRNDGSEIIGVMSAKVFQMQNVPHVISITRDISARVRAEEQVRQLNVELEARVAMRTEHLAAINKEITNLTYSISHDLHAPLRAIAGFSQILMEDHLDQLDDEAQRLLGVIQKNTYRMDELLNNMVALLHVSQIELNAIPIDMSGLVYAVYENMVAVEDREKITFNVSPLPEAMGDSGLIRLVWTNLISNAIKYTRPKEVRVIEVGGYSEAGMNVYFVKDSGVGFNPQYIHKLFGLFERLHKVDQFEGIGMGLAIVQRAIQRHRGRVWAEGVPDQGATFYFSIPERKKTGESDE